MDVAAVFDWDDWVAAFLGKNCSFGLLCLSFVSVFRFLCVIVIPF